MDISNRFMLLYNVPGYEQNGTKRVLLRALDTVAEPEEQAFWRLMNENGKDVLNRKLRRLPDTFGMRLWECDFSDIKFSDRYFVEVTLSDTSTLRTGIFPIKQHLICDSVLPFITVYNAHARLAVDHSGGGYYDCNSMMGEAYSHGVFLNGLLQMLIYQKAHLNGGMEKELLKYSQIAFDYLLALIYRQSGEFLNALPERPFDPGHLNSIINTQEGLYGFSAYIDLCKNIDPERSNDKNYQIAVKCVQFLEDAYNKGARGAYPHGENLIVVYFHLYQYSGEFKWMKKASDYLTNLMDTVDLREMERGCWRGIPLFEGLYLMCRSFPVQAEKNGWIKKAAELKQYYRHVLERNAFNIFPVSSKEYAAHEWDHMEEMPNGCGPGKWMANCYRLTSALDACFIGMLTNDKELERVATGELNYILGMNFGLPSDMTVMAENNGKPENASFINGLPGRHAKAWSKWYFKMGNEKWMSIVNGYMIENGCFAYKDDWKYAETFIKTDGIFIYAACVYDEWLNNLNSTG